MENEVFENDVVIRENGQKELLMEKKIPEDSDSDSEAEENGKRTDLRILEF